TAAKERPATSDTLATTLRATSGIVATTPPAMSGMLATKLRAMSGTAATTRPATCGTAATMGSVTADRQLISQRPGHRPCVLAGGKDASPLIPWSTGPLARPAALRQTPGALRRCVHRKK